jgi:multidrug efflux pump subunit AcrB
MAVTAFLSTLAICIVFVSVVFLTGPAKYLFTPLALAVVFAMLASYLLSRTLVPVMVKYLIRGHEGEKPGRNLFTRVQNSFNRGFDGLRQRYVDALAWSLQNRATVFVLFLILVGSAFAILRSAVAISSRLSMRASSVCMSTHRPARASRKAKRSSRT